MSQTTVENTTQFAAFIGLDWADQKHDLCLSTADSQQVEQIVLEQSTEAIDEWACRLRKRFGGRPVAICLEQSRGALVYALMKYDFLVLFPLSPARLAKYRQAVTCSGAKDDPTDAKLIWEYLVRHRDRLVPWKPGDPLTREIALLAEARRDAIGNLTPLTTDPAIVHSSVMKVHMLVAQLRPLARSIAGYDRRLKQLMHQHPDAGLYDTLPGAGDALAPRLLAAFGEDRSRMDSAAAMQCLSGIAPVTRRSGKRSTVQRRWACAKFLRQTFHEFAHHSRYHSAWAKAFYKFQRDKGKGHHAAVRALAFKWLRILFRCWKTRTVYDEAVYLNTLNRRNSPLLQYLDQPTTASA